MITDLDRMECPSVKLGGEKMAMLKDLSTGGIEVIAAVNDTPAVRQKAQALTAGQLLEGRKFAVCGALQRILGLGFVYCSLEYQAAYAQELGPALKQGMLLQRILRDEAVADGALTAEVKGVRCA